MEVCREYSRIWGEFFQYFAEGLGDKKIYQKDEENFQQLIKTLAMNHYKFSVMVKENFKGADEILEVLCDAVSLQNLKGMSEAQFSKLQVSWHTLFIEMNKAMGKFMLKLPVAKG
ncbi:MAG: hypothetical protein V2A74_14435 [bacterium]